MRVQQKLYDPFLQCRTLLLENSSDTGSRRTMVIPLPMGLKFLGTEKYFPKSPFSFGA